MHSGSTPNLSMYPLRLGRTLAFHFDVELSDIERSAWSTNGLLKRSVTEAANSFSSSSGRVSVGIISLYIVLFMKPFITSSFMQSRTMSYPARDGPRTMEVCAPFNILTLRCLYGLWLSQIITGRPALSNGSSSFSHSGPSITHRPNTSPTSRSLSL